MRRASSGASSKCLQQAAAPSARLASSACGRGAGSGWGWGSRVTLTLTITLPLTRTPTRTRTRTRTPTRTRQPEPQPAAPAAAATCPGARKPRGRGARTLVSQPASQSTSNSVASKYVCKLLRCLPPAPNPNPNLGAPHPHPTRAPTAPLLLALPVAGTGGDARVECALELWGQPRRRRAPAQGAGNGRHALSRALGGSARRPPLGI